MKREECISVYITKDEKIELTKYRGQYMANTGNDIKNGAMIRKIVLDEIRKDNILIENPIDIKYIESIANKQIESIADEQIKLMNDEQDSVKDNKQEDPPTTPHDEPSDSTNPFADLNF